MRRWKSLLSLAAALLLLAGTGCDKGSKDSKKSDNKSEKSQNKKEEGDDKKDESASNSELPYEATGPVAKVDGKEITAEEYNEIVKKRHSRSRRPLPKAMAKRMKSETLNALIDKHLIEREIEAADVEVSDKEADEEFKKFKERFPNDKALESFLKFRGIDRDEIKGKMRKDLALKKILRDREGIEVTDKEAKKYYENNAKEFEQKEQVKARHILINMPKKGGEEAKKKAKKKAQKIAEEAKKEGTDFAKLAKEKSEGPSAKKGGDLGYFSKNRMVPAFSDAAFNMKDGEISDPVETKFGYHIIKREGHKEARKKSFDEVKTQIVDKLEKKRFRRALDGFVSDLKKKAEIEKMPDNIKVNVTEKAGGPGGGLKGLGNIGGGKGGGGKLKLKMKQLKKLKQKAAQQAAQKKEESSSGSSESKGSEGSGE